MSCRWMPMLLVVLSLSLAVHAQTTAAAGDAASPAAAPASAPAVPAAATEAAKPVATEPASCPAAQCAGGTCCGSMDVVCPKCGHQFTVACKGKDANSSPIAAKANAATSPGETVAASSQASVKSPIKLSVFSHGSIITPIVGQSVIVELEGKSDSQWKIQKVEGEALQQIGSVEFQPSNDDPKIGVFVATFKAAKDGKSFVRLNGVSGKDKVAMEFTATVKADK